MNTQCFVKHTIRKERQNYFSKFDNKFFIDITIIYIHNMHSTYEYQNGHGETRPLGTTFEILYFLTNFAEYIYTAKVSFG